VRTFQGDALDSAAQSDYDYHCQGRAVRPLPLREDVMAWKTPKIREICIGMEINAYMPSEL
jgi:coenzyme PQQ precursor peptide PqqA